MNNQFSLELGSLFYHNNQETSLIIARKTLFVSNRYYFLVKLYLMNLDIVTDWFRVKTEVSFHALTEELKDAVQKHHS